MFEGILLMKIFDDMLVITYDTDKIKFNDIVQLILSLGVGVFLRKVIISVNTKALDAESLSKSLIESVDGVVELILDPYASLISILVHPDVDLNEVINLLKARGVNAREVVIDEVSQVMMARS
jgi:transcriptional/translational regulatory protein YebC/TACO1